MQARIKQDQVSIKIAVLLLQDRNMSDMENNYYTEIASATKIHHRLQ